MRASVTGEHIGTNLPSEEAEDFNPEPMKMSSRKGWTWGCGGESDSLEKKMRKRMDEEEEEKEEEGDSNPV